MYGLNREVLEGHVLEPDELLEKIDAVTAADVQRVAQDLIARDKLRLAVIGPFENRDEHFAAVLA
jgi:predicted Zn-dependent peptidase